MKLLYLFILLMSFMSTALLAQFPLELGFEQLSIEGIQRPWGWSVFSFAPNAKFQCDSLVTKTGQYSLHIQNKKSPNHPRFELAYFIEPFQLLGKIITIEAWAKTSEMAGEAGFLVQSFQQKEGEYLPLKEAKQKVNSSNEWKKYTLQFPVSAKSNSIFIILYTACEGSVWFDDIQISVDGKILKKVAVAPDFTKTEQTWINENVQPFQTIEPHLSFELDKKNWSDLACFKKMVGDARIIGLGEATHGTSEFFKLKHRLLQYAIEELEVRTFVLEDNQLLVRRVNDYVVDGKGTAKTAMKGLFSVWNTNEMLNLIEWLRDYNRTHPKDKVTFWGMDVQNPQLALDSLQAFLIKKDSVLAKSAADLLANFQQNWQNAYFVEDSIKKIWQLQTEEVRQLVFQKSSVWMETANTKADTQSIKWAMQNAQLLTQSVASITTGGFEGRDKAMAENVSWVLEQQPRKSRVIVWAHDSHIARGEASLAKHNYFNGQSMGAFLSKKYGNQYRAFGLSTYKGSCRAVKSYSDFTPVQFKIFPAPLGSLDKALHQAAFLNNNSYLTLDLRPLRKTSSFSETFSLPRPVRHIGYVAEDYGFGAKYIIPYQFDGIFFIETSTASTAISP